MKYVDAGYAICLGVLFLYATSVVVRRRRLGRADALRATTASASAPVPGPVPSSAPVPPGAPAPASAPPGGPSAAPQHDAARLGQPLT